MNLLALTFPDIGHLLEWPNILPGLDDNSIFALNKVGIIYIFALVAPVAIFMMAKRRYERTEVITAPSGIQTVAETSVTFIRENIIMQTIGPDGLRYLPFLLTLFFFILFSNITEVFPFIHFPANARMAMPVVLAVLVWVVFNAVGIKNHGLFGYLKNVVIPPGVPKALLPLVALIEFVSTFIVRPFSLAVRLFANMLAGHLLLVTFGVLTAALWDTSPLAAIVWAPFVVLIGLTGFEILVAFLQAFIFTILTAVYIGGALHPEH
ncbi:F0F1 ATP synthase subunit A [Candidatus Poriferisodalis sp.]|uniref:F0F1 ATP synthase subunit A n=1 Tax=Candidatus Poriferisodalis sp. TaxID=3101277 RepID=UPI003C6F0E77